MLKKEKRMRQKERQTQTKIVKEGGGVKTLNGCSRPIYRQLASKVKQANASEFRQKDKNLKRKFLFNPVLWTKIGDQTFFCKSENL